VADAIVTDRLTKRYGDLVAVDQVDLTVHTGEIFGFLGPNGAGKSTAIRCLLDQARPTSGNAQVLGLDSQADSVAIHARVGYLPGDLELYENLTGEENLHYLANLRGGVDWAVVDALADRFGADLSRKAGDYSSGNRQKVGLIQAFMHVPDLLILDEPTTGLDPLVQQMFHQLLDETRDEGRTVFLSSHTLSEVELVADRVGIIRHGRLVEVASVAELKAKAIRRVDLDFDQEVDAEVFRALDGVREVEAQGRHASVSFDGPVEHVLLAAAELGVVNLHSREADLEQIFLTYYRDGADVGPDTEESTGEAADADR
jgi:ABC-2 type transport system ATP-binding protein